MMATPQPEGAPSSGMPPSSEMPPQGGAFPPPYQPFYPTYPQLPYSMMPVRAQLPTLPRAVWSMVLGIAGIVGGFLIGFIAVLIPSTTFTSISGTSGIFGYFTIVTVIEGVVPLAISIVAVVLGHSSLTQIRRGLAGGQGYAIAGLVLGYVGIGLRVAGILLDVFIARLVLD